MAAGGSRGRVPCSVITGFLGAGKTTLVNHILTAQHGRRVAVVENEFGEVGVDAGLVEGATGAREEIFEMSNGCVCCTVRGDLIRILRELLARPEPFDHILIETTGLADPAPVAQTFYMDEDLKRGLALDAVITVVDAKHVLLHLDERKAGGAVNECLQQVAFADRLLLNKVDLVDGGEKARVLRRLREVNGYCRIVETTQSSVSVDEILGIEAFSLERMLEKGDAFVPQSPPSHAGTEGAPCGEANCADPDCSHHSHDHVHGHDHSHHHDSSVSSVGLECAGSVCINKVNTWLSSLLRDHGPDLYRSKGILAVEGSDHKFVFQGVHSLLTMTSSEEGIGRDWRPGEKRSNRIVFIGKHLHRAQLEADFKACLV